MLLVVAGSYCSLFGLPGGELVSCFVFCSIYSFFCDERVFLCCCSAEWEESIPVKKFFVQSAAGVLTSLMCKKSSFTSISPFV